MSVSFPSLNKKKSTPALFGPSIPLISTKIEPHKSSGQPEPFDQKARLVPFNNCPRAYKECEFGCHAKVSLNKALYVP